MVYIHPPLRESGSSTSSYLDSYTLSYAEHFLIIITKIINRSKASFPRRKGLESTKEDQNNKQNKDKERTRMILNCVRGLTKLKERIGYVHPDRTAYATTILQLFSSPVTH